MTKIYTFTVTEAEIDKLNTALDELGSKIIDIDKSKEFEVMGFTVSVYVVVTDEESFEYIREAINGIRLY